MLQSSSLSVMIICTLSGVLRREEQQSEAEEAVLAKGSVRQVETVKKEGMGSTHSAS